MGHRRRERGRVSGTIMRREKVLRKRHHPLGAIRGHKMAMARTTHASDRMIRPMARVGARNRTTIRAGARNRTIIRVGTRRILGTPVDGRTRNLGTLLEGTLLGRIPLGPTRDGEELAFHSLRIARNLMYIM